MDGDFPVSATASSTSDLSQEHLDTSIHSSNASLVPVGDVQQICDISKSQHERVIEDLCEAMKENTTILAVQNKDEKPLTGVKMFFFPGEDVPKIDTELMSDFPQITRDLGDTTNYVRSSPPKRSDTDDEYDIIEKEAEIEEWVSIFISILSTLPYLSWW